MKVIKRCLVPTIILFMMVIVFGLFADGRYIFFSKSEMISIIKDTSHFRNIIVSENAIEVQCQISLKNETAQRLCFTIKAIMFPEYIFGSTSDIIVHGLCDNESVLYINPYETQSFDLSFLYTKGWGPVFKCNRLLPPLLIEPVIGSSPNYVKTP